MAKAEQEYNDAIEDSSKSWLDVFEAQKKVKESQEEFAEIDDKISQCGSDYVKLQELTEQKENFEKELEEAMDRWVYLNELNEEIERNKKGL